MLGLFHSKYFDIELEPINELEIEALVEIKERELDYSQLFDDIQAKRKTDSFEAELIEKWDATHKKLREHSIPFIVEQDTLDRMLHLDILVNLLLSLGKSTKYTSQLIY
mmetsp:Transcript_13180/g.22344  ORF Transcript_13180/g.22344 Transcript_13180/m.22344 type:complete len:109 (+) Transcript_13180:640-966(+)|eukprot:CAMPEP_0168621206 /NCGR_PEP_ID=MMETSP0449_2-20121227/7562_1 /TAXON_ID=1082188 /ORGANISM="Strombidium rassoulzadegani, Strain ras09" /LENGTH=108 /DNA_ID=CAMNT_0008662293 /DNA_START=588 /DNA_END=914 /DNA_ORIENTATION=+